MIDAELPIDAGAPGMASPCPSLRPTRARAGLERPLGRHAAAVLTSREQGFDMFNTLFGEAVNEGAGRSLHNVTMSLPARLRLIH